MNNHAKSPYNLYNAPGTYNCTSWAISALQAGGINTFGGSLPGISPYAN